jgi:hypothetical protein
MQRAGGMQTEIMQTDMKKRQSREAAMSNLIVYCVWIKAPRNC